MQKGKMIPFIKKMPLINSDLNKKLNLICQHMSRENKNNPFHGRDHHVA